MRGVSKQVGKDAMHGVSENKTKTMQTEYTLPEAYVDLILEIDTNQYMNENNLLWYASNGKTATIVQQHEDHERPDVMLGLIVMKAFHAGAEWQKKQTLLDNEEGDWQ